MRGRKRNRILPTSFESFRSVIFILTSLNTFYLIVWYSKNYFFRLLTLMFIPHHKRSLKYFIFVPESQGKSESENVNYKELTIF